MMRHAGSVGNIQTLLETPLPFKYSGRPAPLPAEQEELVAALVRRTQFRLVYFHFSS